MGELIQGNARGDIHSISTPGATFSIGPSNNFADGTWNTNGSELMDKELGLNEYDKRLYLRIGSDIEEIALVGSTAAGNNLEQTLSLGNNSGSQSIVMGTGSKILSANLGGQIELDASGTPGQIHITTDNGGFSTAYLLLSNTFSNAQLAAVPSYKQLNISNSTTTLSQLNVLTNDGGQLQMSDSEISFLIQNNSAGVLGETYRAGDNTLGTFILSNADMFPSAVSSRGGTMGQGVYNSALIGGVGLVALTHSTAYVPNLNIQSGKRIYSSIGNQFIDMNSTGVGGGIVIAGTGGVLGGGNYLEVTSDDVSIGAIDLINLNAGDSVILNTLTYSHRITNTVGVEQLWHYKQSSVVSTTGSVTIMATISTDSNFVYTVSSVAQGRNAASNRAYSSTIFGSFLNSGGTLTQIGTIDNLSEKSSFTSGENAGMTVSGTNILLYVIGSSGNTINWSARYDYCRG